MIKLTQSRLVGIGLLCSIFLLAISSNPPNGRTGAPGDSLCSSGCHTGTNAALNGDVTISGLPASIDANMTYTITVTVDNPNGAGVRGGFQWVALDANNNDVGTMSNSDGNSTITPSGGRTYHEHSPAQNFNGANEASYTVDWTAPNGPNNEVITFYAAGVIANGAGGNSGDRVVTDNVSSTLIASSSPPSVTVNFNNDVRCFGGADGSATAVVTGGTPPYNYSWDNGETTATAINLTAGIHFVVITDAANMTTTGSVSIFEPPAINLFVANIDDEVCNGANGSAAVMATGGTMPYGFNWSNGDSGSVSSGLAAGTYTCTLTDANLCTETITVTVGSDPGNLMVQDTLTIEPSCFGGADGSIAIEVTNATGMINYQWSNMATTPTISNLTAGSYTVTVSDGAGCQTSSTFTLGQPTQVQVSISATDVSCFGASDGSVSALASGGTGMYDFAWSQGPVTTDLGPGTYFLTVTDGNDCALVDSVVITQPAEIIASFNTSDLSCFGDMTGSITLNASGGEGPLSYSWSDGNTSQDRNNLPADFYSVEITDSTNCSIVIDSIIVTQPDTFTLTPVIVNAPGCGGMQGGTITAVPSGGTAPYDYQWAIGFTMDTIIVLEGFYPVTVTDANDCVATTFVNLSMTDTNPPTINATDFTLYLDEQGMTPTVVESFFDLGSTDDCELAGGFMFDATSYNCSQSSVQLPISLMDVNNNTAFDTITITILDTLAPILNCPMDATVMGCNQSMYTIPTATDNCEVMNVELISGVNPGDDLVEGENVVVYQATDSSGNTSECSFIITLNSNFQVDLVTTDVSCFGFQDGTVQLNTTGGVPPYNFETDPVFDADFLTAGTYFVTITDDSNCFLTDSFVIEQPELLVLDGFNITNSTNSNSGDGAIDITIVGGVGPYTYEWFLDGVSISMDEDISNLAPGLYTCVVTDSVGCIYNSIDFVVEATTSTNDVFFTQVEIFPNPARNWLNINIERTDYNINSIELMSLSGKLIYQDFNPKSSNRLEVSTYPSGLYLLKIDTGDDQFYKKIIID
jgi:hypothetical protein